MTDVFLARVSELGEMATLPEFPEYPNQRNSTARIADSYSAGGRDICLSVCLLSELSDSR